jgi:hypothetical protein
VATSLLFTIEVSARPTNSGDGNNEHYTAQAVARNGEPLLYYGESATLSDALRQVVDTIKEQENRKENSQVHYRPDNIFLPLLSRLCRAIRIR